MGKALNDLRIQSFVNQTWLGRYEVPVDDYTIWSFIVSVFSLGGWVGAIHSGTPCHPRPEESPAVNNIVALLAALLMGFSLMAKSFDLQIFQWI